MTNAESVGATSVAMNWTRARHMHGAAVGWAIVFTTIAACSPDDGDRAPPVAQSAAESSGAVAATTPVRTCVPPQGPLAADASLSDLPGTYLLTMVEEVDGSPSRTAEGLLSLRAQEAGLRQFSGSAGGSIPRVISPLYGSTDLDVEAVGAVRVGDLSSEDPASPGVLVIESATGAGASILIRLGSDANRRDLVRFDSGYTVLTVVEIDEGSFSGTWSSGARLPESSGFFCAASEG